MALHRIWQEEFPDQPGLSLVIQGDEAQHAIRVKRLETGNMVQLLDGRGRIGLARIDRTGKSARHGWELVCTLSDVTREPKPSRPLHILTAVPKGDRLEQMIDGLVQAGVSTWSPLECDRAVVEPREGKLARLQRVVHEASKQSGRAWMMELAPATSLDDVLADLGAHGLVIFADGSGLAAAPCAHAHAWKSGSGPVSILIGPEGGWSDRECSAARAAGVTATSFGPHVLRIETAAVVAAAVVMNLLM